MLEELLKKYDLAHTSIICGGKVNLNINYLLDNKIYISISNLFNGNEIKYSYDYKNDENFTNYILPKIFQRFISKNVSTYVRKIMVNDQQGTFVIERKDNKDSLIVRNCSIEIINLLEKLLESFNTVSNADKTKRNKIIFTPSSNNKFNNYIKCNTIYDYAKYRVSFFKGVENRNIDSDVKKIFDDDEANVDSTQLLILNIARYAYTFESLNNGIWDEIKENYKESNKIVEICENFKNEKFEEYTTYCKALILAEYEKNNDVLINSDEKIVEEALEACNKKVSCFNENYLEYWDTRQEYYSSLLDGARQAICIDFKEAYDLSNKKKIEKKEDDKMGIKENKSIIERFKEIKDQTSFARIINDPIVPNSVEDEVEKIFLDIDKEKIKHDAEEQARKIIEIEKERNQLRKDAEEFAKIIIKNQKEYKKILIASEEQARRIIELEKENEELKKLAEENAKYLFDRNKKFYEEEQLREYMNNSPVKSQDIDKINNLLNALSEVKGIDFAVNHPTSMQEILFLEEKIITYLTTHKNIVYDEDKIVPIEKEEMKESKPVIELLTMIRNAYVSSHMFEKDGRHTLIELNPVDDDTYRVTLYSVKEDSEDILMDAFFEEDQLTDNVLKEICDIFSTDAVIVASKIDNIPPDKADYLVIDNMDNAIKFMDFKRELIDKIKEYL